MWWIISVISFVLLTLESAVTTLMVIILLNGYSSLPDSMVVLYMLCSGGLVLALSVLNGWLAMKLSQVSRLPLWLGGILLTIASLVIMPVVQFVLTFFLLGVFGKL